MKRVIVRFEFIVLVVAFFLLLAYTQTGLQKRIQSVDELKQNVHLVAKNTKKEALSTYGDFFRSILDDFNGFLRFPGQ